MLLHAVIHLQNLLLKDNQILDTPFFDSKDIWICNAHTKWSNDKDIEGRGKEMSRLRQMVFKKSLKSLKVSETL